MIEEVILDWIKIMPDRNWFYTTVLIIQLKIEIFQAMWKNKANFMVCTIITLNIKTVVGL